MSDAPSSPPAPGEVRLSLLFVEDHEATSVVMAKLLRRRGHTVVTVSSRAEAEAAAAVGKFDCLISDLRLPDGSGHDLMRAMRERYGLAGIAVSGSGDLQEALASGFSQHFTKPVDIDCLHRALLEVAAEARA